MLDPRYAWLRRLIALGLVLALWEAAGRAGWLNPLFAPSPSRVWAALVDLFADGRIWPHLEATFSAALGGLALGIVVGVLLGVAAALDSPRCRAAGAGDERAQRHPARDPGAAVRDLARHRHRLEGRAQSSSWWRC